MGAPRFAPEFKQEAVKQVNERGYSVPEVAARVGVSAHCRCCVETPSIPRDMVTACCLDVFEPQFGDSSNWPHLSRVRLIHESS